LTKKSRVIFLKLFSNKTLLDKDDQLWLLLPKLQHPQCQWKIWVCSQIPTPPMLIKGSMRHALSKSLLHHLYNMVYPKTKGNINRCLSINLLILKIAFFFVFEKKINPKDSWIFLHNFFVLWKKILLKTSTFLQII
jgi:hypothetical protein